MLRGSSITRQRLITDLTKGVCKVHFQKVLNGRFRLLHCTLDPLKIVPKNATIGIHKQIRDYDLLPVFDLVSNSWKSFRISRVIGFYNTKDLYPAKKAKV